MKRFFRNKANFIAVCCVASLFVFSLIFFILSIVTAKVDDVNGTLQFFQPLITCFSISLIFLGVALLALIVLVILHIIRQHKKHAKE